MNVPSDPILVVDDVDANRDMLARRLARLGYRVEEASSGQDALAYLALYPVSAVLLDIEMPGMSGIDVLRAIRVTWTPAQLPVLMVTARDQNEDIVAALDLGANDYITKPLNFPVALARLRTQLCLKDAEDRLRASEERYALAAKGANDGLWDWDLLTGQFYYSNRWKAIIGYEDEGVGSGPDKWFGRVHSEDLPRLHRDLDAHLSGATPHFENEHRMRHKSGSFRWVLTRGLAVRDRDGRPIRMAGSQSDITEGKVVDALTGLPNRMLLVDRLERALHQHRSMGSVRPAVLFIDLDGFKFVNDSFGHLYGDELLQAVARRFESSLRYSDTVSRSSAAEHTVLAEHTLARVGGDEFVILLPDVRDIVDATRVAERIQRVLTRPFNIGGRDVFTTASIGIAMSSGTQARPEDLLRDADTAMYRAKALGKGRCEVFDAAMREQVLERVRLDTALRQGLERHEFLPYFQPIVKLDTGELAGFEALLRWRQPDGTIVRPGTFVSMIEENGLVVPIGTKFIADVCRQFRMWQDEDPSARLLSIDVNFASLQLMESGLLDKLLGLLSHTGLEPAHLVIEITETTAIGNFDQASEVLGRMRNAGIRVMLDDFGTGYSSLSCLHELPICGIKLDRSFINRTHRHPAILPAILRLADQLDLTVVAEGVEAVEQWQELRSLGCDLAQGFLFARPMDAEAAGALLRERRVWQPQAATSSSVA